VIIIIVSLLALGARAGAVVALSIPLTLAIVFPLMMTAGIDLQRISLGALIIALTLLVATLTLSAGRTTILQGAVHVVRFCTFLFLAAVP
jgi:Ca2+/H+ antiporter